MAEVTILTGRAGSGKSRCLRAMAAELIHKGEPVLYIVPEQFTFETERALAQDIGAGLWDAGVYSFTSLARRVLKDGGERRSFMSAQGKLMIIRKCVTERAPKLKAFQRVCQRSGFADECSKFFIEAKRAGITAEELMKAAEKQGMDSPFGAKLHDLSMIYKASEEYMASMGIDAEDSLKRLAELLPKSGLTSRHVIIDGFDMISKQLYSVIGALMDSAASMHVALRLDASPECRDAAVFGADARILANILALCEERNIHPKRVSPHSEPVRHTAKALIHLEKEGFAFPYNRFEGDSDGAIELFAATDIKAEVTAAAEKVLALEDEGFRYRDIAIIASNTDKYLEPMSRALRERGIPFFTDAKRQLLSYSACELTLLALKLASGSYIKEDMIALSKTGLVGLDAEQEEYFENYVLSRGIRGSMFARPFDATAPEKAEQARRILMEPLNRLSDALKSSPTAGEKARALYEYTKSIALREQLEAEAERLRQEGRLERAEETAQVYNTMLEVIDQLYTIMGGARLTNRRFISVYKEGLGAYEIGVIPAAADQLLLGSLGRSKARGIRALIILGAANGHFPAVHGDDGMIDDEERALIGAMGLGELQDTSKLNDKELGDAYGAVTKPTDKLWLSYTMGGGSDADTACELIDRITDMFADVRLESSIEGVEPRSVQSAYNMLVNGLREGTESGAISENTERLYSLFSRTQGYSERLCALERALFPSVSPDILGGELAAKLYGKPLRCGITQLESFNRCPFRHFARYGLKLMPRKEFRELQTDEGTFCHEALSRFTKELIASGKGINDIISDDIERMLDMILPGLIKEHNNGVLTDSARNRAAAARLIRRVKATAYAVVEQLRRGKFNIAKSEVEFGPNGEYPELILEMPSGARFMLSGRIDRIDACSPDNGSRYVRVIDYKTRYGADFNAEDIADGTKLQLPLYIAAIEAAATAERTAGMYYLPVHEGIIKDDGDKKDFAERLLREFRLRGASLNDAELIELGGGDSVQPTARSGWRLSKQQLDYTIGRAKQKAAQTAESIAEGEADALPLYKGNKRSECANCNYPSLCGFDAALPCCAYRIKGKLNTQQFLKEASDAVLDR